MSPPQLSPAIIPRRPRILRAVLYVTLVAVAIPVLFVLAEIVMMIGGDGY